MAQRAKSDVTYIDITPEEYVALCHEMAAWLSDAARIGYVRRAMKGVLTHSAMKKILNGEYSHISLAYEIDILSNDVRLMLGAVRRRRESWWSRWKRKRLARRLVNREESHFAHSESEVVQTHDYSFAPKEKPSP